MASTDDVVRYLARRISDVIYPGGCRLPGIVNASVKIYPGWPVPEALQHDIDNGGVHISVWPLPTERKINTALGRPGQTISKGKPTLQFRVNGSLINVDGIASAPVNVRVSLDDRTYFFHFQTGTTAEKVIEKLSSELPGTFTVLSKLCVLVVNQISVYATTTGTAVRELRRQLKDFQVTVWAPTPELRGRIGTAIDTALSAKCHIDLKDGAPAQLLYARQFDSDRSENWHVYRRDLVFSVNYATTQTITAPGVINTVVTLNGQQQTSR